MLDVIRTYCATDFDAGVTPRSSISSEKSLSLIEEPRESTVREAIFSLIRFYMLKNATVDEIDAVLAFIISCGISENKSEQKAAVEALKSMTSLLKKPGCENLVRILFEAERGELLWVSLVKPGCLTPSTTSNLLSRSSSSTDFRLQTCHPHLPDFRHGVISLFLSLLKSPYISDAYRGRLRLSQCGMGGFFMKFHHVTTEKKFQVANIIHQSFIELIFKCDFQLEVSYSMKIAKFKLKYSR